MKKQRIFASVFALVFAFTVLPADVFAKGGGGGFSSGSRGGGFSSSPSRSFSSPSPSKTYSSPSTSSSSKTWSTPDTSSKPSIPWSSPKTSEPAKSAPTVTPNSPGYTPKSGFGSGVAKAQKSEESKKAYDAYKSETSKSTESSRTSSKISSTTTRDYRDQQVKDLKRDLSYERYQNRELRKQQYYGAYYGRPAYCCYNDGFNIWFWLWLMDRPRVDRDNWVYNHYNEIDPSRLSELRRNDADMDRRLRDLENQGAKRDASYVPQGMERDLMYNDDVVKQAHEEKNTSHFPWGWMLAIAAVAGLAYLVFFVRFKVRKA